MIGVTGAGPVPASDPLDAQLAVVDELTSPPADEGIGIPFEVQAVAEPGPFSNAVGRAVSLLDQLYAETGPHGWKLADRPGRDLARAQSRREEHLAALEIALAGYTGALTIGSLGPISLAAELYTARADRVIADPAAVTDLAHALAEGIREHIAAVRSRVPGISQMTLLLDEPLLAPALVGALPNFSGMFRIRALDGDAARETLGTMIEGVKDPAVVHLGPSAVGLEMVSQCGVAGIGIDLPPWDEARWASLAQVVESGTPIWWGMPAPALSQCAGPQIVALADQLWQPWRRIGLTGSMLLPSVLFDRDAGRTHSMSQVRDHLASLVRVSHILAERTSAG
ncbi:hypothetical protein SAMN06309944_2414 [Micrococcales bacterium KH10]|nr:hypothetical protein SAMN06309944_2414 [Micrococcales bacterium KH10]